MRRCGFSFGGRGQRLSIFGGEKKDSSFLKKRSKKLFDIGTMPVVAARHPGNKSFLVLSFKKELVSDVRDPQPPRPVL
jgi:hypothetical protein